MKMVLGMALELYVSAAGLNELWAGTPARKLRGNVSWSGVSDPSPEAIKNLISGNV